MNLKIATNLTLPESSVTDTFAILGKRGVGKTYTAAVMAEEMLGGGLQVVVFDPLDVWWGLRSSASGKDAGLPIIVAGGERGDLPLAVESAAILADFAVEERQSIVLSTRHLSKTGQRQFIGAFAERLYERKGKAQHRTPLHLMIDEADEFCPQRLYKGVERCFGAVDQIVRRGRASGLGATLITQRSAAINKDVLSQVEVLVAHRTISPHDRKAIDAWIETHDAHDQRREFLDSLPMLAVGEAWFWSPGWLDLFRRVKVRKRHTFDSSYTPSAGVKARAPKRLAAVDLERLRERLADTIERQKADDPRELKKRISELERQVRDLEKRPTETKIERVEVPVFKNGVADRLYDVVGKLRVSIDVLTTLHDGIDSDVRHADQIVKRRAGAEKGPVQATAPRLPAMPTSRPARAPAASTRISESEFPAELNDYQQSLLQVLIDRHPIPTPRAQLGGLAGKSIKSSMFSPNLRGLVERGLAVDTRQGYAATDAGLAALPGYTRAPAQGGAALAHWLGRLPTYHATILKVLAAHFPHPLSRDDIADRTGYSQQSSMFRPAIRDLLEQQFAVEVRDGGYTAAAFFFED